MLDRDELLKLVAAGESRNVDFKRGSNWASFSRDEKCELTKDVLAMANTPGGGHIIIGVEDATHAVNGLTAEDAAGWDPTPLNDFVAGYTDPPHVCEVQRLTVDDVTVVVLTVPEFTDTPIICKRDANTLHAGAVYVRSGAAESRVVASADQMRELLARGMLRQGDRLVQQIDALLRGRPPAAADAAAAYAEDLQSASGFFDEHGPQDDPHWELVIAPLPHVPNRFPNLAAAQAAVRQSEVALRGWNFPHTDANAVNARNFASGFQSVTDWRGSPFGRHREAYRVYLSGLFAWHGDYWDAAATEANAIVFTWVVYQTTEFLNFAARYCATAAPEASARITINLTGTQNRRLISAPGGMPLLSGDYSCLDPTVTLTDDIPVSEVRADPDRIARDFARRIFERFNWNRPDDAMIRGWQDQLRRAFGRPG